MRSLKGVLNLSTQNNFTQRLFIFQTQQSFATESQNTENNQSNQQEDNLKLQIIQNSLLHVNRHGWNQQAIASGCVDLNLSSASQGLLEKGPFDLVEYMMSEWNTKAIEKVKLRLPEIKGTKNQISESLKQRLSLQIPYINRWNEAMALGIHPSNFLTTQQLLWEFADEVWFLAGDRSQDYNYYTKRSLLLGVYASTEMYMLTDKSIEFFETWNFMERRLNEISLIGQTLGSAQNIFSVASTGFLNMLTLIKPFPPPESIKPQSNIQEIRQKQQQNQESKV